MVNNMLMVRNERRNLIASRGQGDWRHIYVVIEVPIKYSLLVKTLDTIVLAKLPVASGIKPLMLRSFHMNVVGWGGMDNIT